MNKLVAYFIAFAAFVLLINSVVPVLPGDILPRLSEIAADLTTHQAQAAQGGPNQFQLSIMDNGCSDQYEDYGYASYTTPTGQDSGYVTDANGKDPDCARIRMDAGDTSLSNGAMYNSDFRIGITLAESGSGCTDRKGTPIYTPWASEGGGSASTYANGSIDAADCIWIYYQTRPLPNGSVRIVDTQAGIAVGASGMNYTPWASAGGGWSSWARTGNDFTVAAVALNVKLNYKYNAAYVNSTIPQYPPNTLNKNTPTNYNVVMKNIPDVGQTTAMPWVSDQEVSSSTNKGVAHCYEWVPTSSSETCTQTTVYTSTKFKLRRIDSNTSAIQTTAGDLPYQRTVVSQWNSSQVWYDGQCYPSGGAMLDDHRSFAQIFDLFNTAYAMPIEPGGGGEICDPPYPSNPPEYNASFVSQDQSIDVQNNQSATFNLSLTAVADGDYQLQFQMVNLSTGELFGDPNAVGNSGTIARINVRVGAWALACGADAPPVIAGQTVSYAVNATGTPPGPISVTMTSNPAGPTMTNSPLTLNSTNSYAGVANVATTGLTPGTYTLTFNGNNGSTNVTCSAHLIINGGTVVSGSTNLAIYQPPAVQFTVNGGTSTNIPVGGTATLSWITTATNSGTACTASGGWTGSKSSTPGTNYFETVGPLNTPGNYTYNLVCTGALNSSTPVASVTVTVSSPPAAPTNVSANNTICGTITISWDYTDPIPATSFRVYRQVSAGGVGSLDPNGWTDISGALGSAVRSFTDNSASPTYNYYMVLAFNSSGTSPNSNIAGPIALNVCSVNISTSDKDLISIQRGSNTITSTEATDKPCNTQSDIFTLPGNGVFRAGDIAKFKINVCNTGNQTLTNVSVVDTLSNLSSPGNYIFSPGGCGNNPVVSGSTLTFSLSSLPAPIPPGSVNICSITFTATVTAPPGPAALYRFQNTAQIRSDQANLTVYTPPYLFQLGAGIPTRTETPPN